MCFSLVALSDTAVTINDPGCTSKTFPDYFDKLAQLPGTIARDVPHLPVVHAFAEQAKNGGYKAAVRRPADDKKQVSILQMISAYRTLGARWAGEQLVGNTVNVRNGLDSVRGAWIEASSTCAMSAAWMRENICPGLTMRRAVPARSLANGPRPGP